MALRVESAGSAMRIPSYLTVSPFSGPTGAPSCLNSLVIWLRAYGAFWGGEPFLQKPGPVPLGSCMRHGGAGKERAVWSWSVSRGRAPLFPWEHPPPL